MGPVLDRPLQIFLAVVRLGSFTRAAKALAMTQPGVSFRVRQLEAHYGCRLFDRNGSRMTLTAAGRMVYEYADSIMGAYAEMGLRVAATTARSEGLLTIGAPAIAAEFMLPRLLCEFVKACPGVQPRVVVDDSRAIERRVAEGTLDLGFTEEEARQGAVSGELCWQDELVAIASPALPLARLRHAGARDLADYPWILQPAGSELRRLADAYLARAGVAPDMLDVVMEMGSATTVCELVESGAGIAIASRASVERALRLGRLAAVALQPRVVGNFWLVQLRQRSRLSAASRFADFAVPRLRALAASAPAPARSAAAQRLALVE